DDRPGHDAPRLVGRRLKKGYSKRCRPWVQCRERARTTEAEGASVDSCFTFSRKFDPGPAGRELQLIAVGPGERGRFIDVRAFPVATDHRSVGEHQGVTITYGLSLGRGWIRRAGLVGGDEHHEVLGHDLLIGFVEVGASTLFA